MSIPLKHHYLPEFYLRRWTGSDGKVTEFTRPRDRLIAKRRHPSATGFERELYAIESRSDPVARQELETGLMSPVDHGASRFLDELFRLPSEGVEPALLDHWAAFVLSLLLRTPYAVQKLKQKLAEREPSVLQSVRGMYDDLRQPDDPQTFGEFVSKDDPMRIPEAFGKLLPQLISSDRSRTAIRRMKWRVVRIGDAPYDLMTSDSPLITSNGIAYRTSFLILPVAPKQFFIGAHREDVVDAFTSQEPRALAHALNDSVTRQARSLVIATDDRQMRFVDNRLGRSGEPVGNGGRLTWKCPIVDLPDGPALF